MKVSGFRDVVDEFRVQTAEESAAFAGVERGDLPPVRVIEDGAVRMVVEVLLTCSRSDACLRYKLPRIGAELEIELRVYWNEKDRMLKLSLPTPFKGGTCLAQSAYGVNVFASSPEERTVQKWAAVLDRDSAAALTVINDGCYGFDFFQGELRFSLLRSAAYAAHPVADGVPILRQDRFEPRIDQGERFFRFWIQGGEAEERRSRIDREAQVKHEPPPALSMNPRSGGERPEPLVCLDGEAVILSACKRAEADHRLVLRFFEPTGKSRRTEIVLPIWNLRFPLELGPFEIKTLCVDPATGQVEETDLLERPLPEGDGAT
jgi:alpha-mannosidase